MSCLLFPYLCNLQKVLQVSTLRGCISNCSLITGDWYLSWLSKTLFLFFFKFNFQSGVGRNGRVVQGYPPIIEAQEEHEDDEEEEEEDDEAMSVSMSSERKPAVDLRDTGGKSPLSRPSQKTTRRSSRRSRRKIQEINPTTLDPSNLSPRWIWSPLICLHV